MQKLEIHDLSSFRCSHLASVTRGTGQNDLLYCHVLNKFNLTQTFINTSNGIHSFHIIGICQYYYIIFICTDGMIMDIILCLLLVGVCVLCYWLGHISPMICIYIVPCHNYQSYSWQFSCPVDYTVCKCLTIQLPIQAVKRVTNHSKAYNGHT